MPVRKFRTIEGMGGPIWHEPGDPVLYKAMRRVWELAHRMLRPSFPPGVYKNRSVESMNARQEAWDDANFAAYHERRKLEMEALQDRP